MIHTSPKGEKFVIYRIGETLAEIEEQVFRVALYHNGGNKSRTAKSLGICIRTCRNKFNLYFKTKMLCGDEDDNEDVNYDGNEADLIPGDNSLPLPPSEIPNPPIPNAPDNLNHIPAQGGDIPIVSEPAKP